MGCSCKNKGMRNTTKSVNNTALRSITPTTKSNPLQNQQQFRILPQVERSSQGKNEERKSIEKKRRDAIRKSLGQ